MFGYQKHIFVGVAGAVLTTAAYLFGLGEPAVAQYSACPAGQTQVGVNPGGNGVGPTPICVANGSGGPNSGAPVFVPSDYYGAVAVSPSGQVFVVGVEKKKSKAVKFVLANCKAATGQKCEVMGTHKNTCVTVAQSARGEYYQGLDGRYKHSATKALGACHENTPGKACSIVVPPMCSALNYASRFNDYHQRWTGEKSKSMTRIVNRLLVATEPNEISQLEAAFDGLRR